MPFPVFFWPILVQLSRHKLPSSGTSGHRVFSVTDQLRYTDGLLKCLSPPRVSKLGTISYSPLTFSLLLASACFFLSHFTCSWAMPYFICCHGRLKENNYSISLWFRRFWASDHLFNCLANISACMGPRNPKSGAGSPLVFPFLINGTLSIMPENWSHVNSFCFLKPLGINS